MSNALGIKIIDGKFVAQLDDFYQQELMDIRSSQMANINTMAAS